jgi:Reverse transcriptase (RNA-dependent DNA polymerase)
MGVPMAMINLIEKMYHGVEITCDVNGVNLSFPSKSGVKQGDPLAPILFLFAIQAALEPIDKQWPVRKPALEWSPLGGHLSARVTRKSLVALTFNRPLFADDTAFVFLSQEELVKGSKHACEHFAKFGLEVHLGNKAGNGKKI